MIEPLKDNVIIEPTILAAIVRVEYKVVLPNRPIADPHFGTVRFVGPDVQVLKPGDLILLPTWNDDELEVDGKKYIVLAEKVISVRISE